MLCNQSEGKRTLKNKPHSDDKTMNMTSGGNISPSSSFVKGVVLVNWVASVCFEK